MAKRKSKQSREADQKAALLQRVTDIYSGAQGQEWSEDDFATAEILSRVLPVIRKTFALDEKIWILGHHALVYFDRPETAAERLYAEGVRA
jgi:hypothetical protein